MPRRPYRQAISIVELRETTERRALRHRRLRVAGIGGGALASVLALAVVTFMLATSHGASADNPAASGFGLRAEGNPRIGVIPHATPAPTTAPTAAAAAGKPAAEAGSGGATSGVGTDGSSAPTSLEPEQLTGYKWPLRGARVTSFFQPRSDGTLVVDGQRIHEGLDLATYCGDVVRAAHDGTVVASGRRFDDEMGFDGPLDAFYKGMAKTMYELPIVVIVDDGNGYRSIYAHLGVASVKIGDKVHAGDQLGFEGASGNASGCHLHYEVFRTDGSWMRIAPDLVERDHYPPYERERIDPFRLLTMQQPGHPRFMPGVDPPKVSPGLGRPTVTRHTSA